MKQIHWVTGRYEGCRPRVTAIGQWPCWRATISGRPLFTSLDLSAHEDVPHGLRCGEEVHMAVQEMNDGTFWLHGLFSSGLSLAPTAEPASRAMCYTAVGGLTLALFLFFMISQKAGVMVGLLSAIVFAIFSVQWKEETTTASVVREIERLKTAGGPVAIDSLIAYLPPGNRSLSLPDGVPEPPATRDRQQPTELPKVRSPEDRHGDHDLTPALLRGQPRPVFPDNPSAGEGGRGPVPLEPAPEPAPGSSSHPLVLEGAATDVRVRLRKKSRSSYVEVFFRCQGRELACYPEHDSRLSHIVKGEHSFFLAEGDRVRVHLAGNRKKVKALRNLEDGCAYAFGLLGSTCAV